MFHVGQKVVCIRVVKPAFGFVVGEIFTVSCVEQTIFGLGLDFEERSARPAVGWLPFYDARNFRPVKPTSIAVFEALLKPVPAPRQREDA